MTKPSDAPACSRSRLLVLVALVSLAAACLALSASISPSRASGTSDDAEGPVARQQLLAQQQGGQQPGAGQTAGGGNGATLFGESCANCHGDKGDGTDAAPSLKAAGFERLVEPKVREGGGGMPAFEGSLSDPDITAVSGYVAGSIADPSSHAATAGEGGTVYRLSCAPCHGSTGRGGALTGGDNAPTLGDAIGADVLIDVQEGPGNMPVFVNGTLTFREQAAAALYVQDVFPDPPSPGGWGIGYWGPVTEGFFALFLGLASLVLLAGWAQGRRSSGLHD